MAVRATISRFPVGQKSLDSSGLPWGVTVTPFALADEHGSSPVYGSDGDLLPRCENCWAYFNSYCELEQWAWTCSLCGTLNGLTSRSIERYSHPQSCAEMCSSFVDLEIPCEFAPFNFRFWCISLDRWKYLNLILVLNPCSIGFYWFWIVMIRERRWLPWVLDFDAAGVILQLRRRFTLQSCSSLLVWRFPCNLLDSGASIVKFWLFMV